MKCVLRCETRLQSWLFFGVAAAILASSSTSFGLITGGEGNERELKNPGWPEGAEAVVNNKARIAWWEGPPFGGGQHHIEYRGDAKALNIVLEAFAKMKSMNKQIVIHDGFVESFWLNPNRSPDKKVNTAMDFQLMVWSRSNWERLRKLPPDFNPVGDADATKGPLSRLDIYAGGSIRMENVKLPPGIPVTDNRLVAHGFTLADGVVYEGKVIDLVSQTPIVTDIAVELIAPRKTGGYDYSQVEDTKTDDQGRFVLRNMPEGWHRIIARSDGYAPRIIGHVRCDGIPRRHWFGSGLAKTAVVSGKVRDAEGNPLPDADVRLSQLAATVGGRYDSPSSFTTKTNGQGEFRLENVPVGSAAVRASKVGYVRPGLSPKIDTPSKNVVIDMMESAFVRVTIDFQGKKRPKQYIVDIAPEGGNKVGSWGGSGHIDENNERIFKNVPPGRYVIHGHPNPTSDAQRTEKVTIDLEGGKTKKVVLMAK